MRSRVKEQLLARKQIASAHVGAILALPADGPACREELRDRFFAYTLAKLGLEDGEAPGRNIEELARASLEKALAAAQATPELESQRMATCDGASSVDMKQALLIMAVQRDFGVRLDGLRCALADTTDELADLVGKALQAPRGS